MKPPASLYSSGSDITLSCSSESKPAAQFQWVLSGTLLGREGPELRLENVQASQSGAYSCRAYNSKTHRSETSSPSTITVLGKPKEKSFNWHLLTKRQREMWDVCERNDDKYSTLLIICHMLPPSPLSILPSIISNGCCQSQSLLFIICQSNLNWGVS